MLLNRNDWVTTGRGSAPALCMRCLGYDEFARARRPPDKGVIESAGPRRPYSGFTWSFTMTDFTVPDTLASLESEELRCGGRDFGKTLFWK
jgi:hypothetical protein